jgi:hypothetical protein
VVLGDTSFSDAPDLKTTLFYLIPMQPMFEKKEDGS